MKIIDLPNDILIKIYSEYIILHKKYNLIKELDYFFNIAPKNIFFPYGSLLNYLQDDDYKIKIDK
tara:strand:+ start:609 stop:803 length:195 start_codon:yes stop_codon:yes gene_type:complete